MRVKELLRVKGNQVVTIQPQNTLLEAAQCLKEHDIGALLVLSPDGSIEGIITERDLVKACAAQKGALDSTFIRDTMSTNLVIGVPEDNLDYILGVMTQNRIRHMPIVNDGKLDGIISIGDVVKARLQETEVQNRYLEEYIYGSYPD